VEIELSDAARDLLGDLGYDPVYGARPLKRVVQKHLVDPLARGLLAGTYAAGDSVSVDAGERSGDERAARGSGELRFTVAVAAEPAVA
jgi:ATP-dependent Clp protease ATP-binding subunit ClpA